MPSFSTWLRIVHIPFVLVLQPRSGQSKRKKHQGRLITKHFFNLRHTTVRWCLTNIVQWVLGLLYAYHIDGRKRRWFSLCFFDRLFPLPKARVLAQACLCAWPRLGCRPSYMNTFEADDEDLDDILIERGQKSESLALDQM